mmetsp:Transcript_29048/g.43808  ORF Transcript_29048/g.43808 Transcript_29048/m.43808 type:complete len:261 (+) Transcript_29048:2-784(+)
MRNDSQDTTFIMAIGFAALAIIAVFSMLPSPKPVVDKKNQSKFLVPSAGGVLQNMDKDEDDNIKLKLTHKIKVSHDSYIYKFGFPDEASTFGLPVGKHVVFNATFPTKAEPNGDEVSRKYTPISEVSQRGTADFLIKIYRAGVHPKFPDGGLMTPYLESMKIGDTMLMEGPKGRLAYEGYGKFIISKKAVEGKTKIGCIAGGTGITPCYQIIQAALKNKDSTQLSLVFGNRTVEDILLKDELLQYAEAHKNNFKLFLTVD